MKSKSCQWLSTKGSFQLARPRFISGIFTLLWLTLASTVEARDFRVNMIPNGSKFGCANCHVSAGGGGARNAFGNAVNARVTPGGAQQFWDAALAAADSDGDGFSNGAELGDPDGDRQNVGPSSLVSNPGNSASKPNFPPAFTSTPVTNAFVGLAYSYQATASDPESQAIVFTKISGPTWLTVSSAGPVSGTPPENAIGTSAVTIRVTDTGSPSQFTNQTYNLVISASFAGWQAANFTLPAEAAIAAPDQDPDGDGLPNLIEYALRKNPKQADDVKALGTPTFDGSGHMTFTLVTRDDDPKLSVTLEAAASVTFATPDSVSAAITDATAGDGLHTRTFTDTATSSGTSTRFGRLKFELLP
jgi:hypothetical protein